MRLQAVQAVHACSWDTVAVDLSGGQLMVPGTSIIGAFDEVMAPPASTGICSPDVSHHLRTASLGAGSRR